MSRRRGAGALWLALLTAACAAHRPQGITDRFIHRDDGGDAAEATFDVAPLEGAGAEAGGAGRPPVRAVPVVPVMKTSDLPTLETEDPVLAAALAALAAEESVAGHRAVAAAYQRAGVFDRAEQHLSEALVLAPRDAEVFGDRARLWRDTRVLGRALSDAHRAVYLSPDSAEAQNTLGTVLFELGRPAEARRRFERAAALDPGAAYARSNLCYVALAGGNLAAALARCDEALRVAPGFEPARRNRALVAAALERAGGPD